MNVMLMTDLEGITNVDSISMVATQKDDSLYIKACENLMQDINAAVCGFIDGGAEDVYVVDGHGYGTNFIHDMLDPRATQLSLQQWQSMITERKVGIYAEVGAHAMAGTPNAFLEHTQSSVTWFNYSVNGKLCGELVMGAAFAGAYGIPMTMISGDIAACEQAKQFLGDIATAPVKRAIGRNTAVSLPSEEARARIYQAAKDSIALADKIPPYRIHLPAKIVLTYTRVDYCDNCPTSENLERIGPRTVCKYVDSIQKYEDLARFP